MKLFLLLLLGGLMHAARSFSPTAGTSPPGVLLSFGYILLTAFFFGDLAKAIRLPRLTGYIAAGVLAGPGVLGFLNEQVLPKLELVNGMAIAFIALSAGCELELKTMRPLMRTIRWVTGVGVMGTVLLLASAIWLMRPLLPFFHGLDPGQQALVALLLGTVLVAQSPAVVIALRDELQADGPLTRSVLGLVILADLVVILLFALVSSAVKAALGVQGSVLAALALVGWEIVGSLAVGAGIGFVLALYMRRVHGGASLFLVAVAFVIAEVGKRLGLDPLLLALAAGLYIRNVTHEAEPLLQELRPVSLPIYTAFFAVAGATLHVEVLEVVGLPVLVIVLVRAFGLQLGSRVGAKLAQAPQVVQRYVGFGLLPQAGLALGLATLFARTFPEFGVMAGALTLGVVAVNEAIAPALFRLALVRSQEANAQTRRVTGEHPHAEAAERVAQPQPP